MILCCFTARSWHRVGVTNTQCAEPDNHGIRKTIILIATEAGITAYNIQMNIKKYTFKIFLTS